MRVKKVISEESAATKIQIAYRDYLSRAKRTNYKPFFLGNEPTFITDEKIDRSFAFVGTSLFKNLEIIYALITDSHKESLTFIPSLFVVDNSRNVLNYWYRLKVAVNKANDFEQFLQFLNSEKLESFFKNRLKLKNSYQFFREIIKSARFICHSWGEERMINYIKGKIPQNTPIVIYLSNIIEYIGCLSNIDYDQRVREVNKILKNTEDLNPTFVIHSRTELNFSVRNFHGKIKPTHFFMSKGAKPELQLSSLRHLGMRPLVANSQELYVILLRDEDKKDALLKISSSQNGESFTYQDAINLLNEYLCKSPFYRFLYGFWNHSETNLNAVTSALKETHASIRELLCKIVEQIEYFNEKSLLKKFIFVIAERSKIDIKYTYDSKTGKIKLSLEPDLLYQFNRPTYSPT